MAYSIFIHYFRARLTRGIQATRMETRYPRQPVGNPKRDPNGCGGIIAIRNPLIKKTAALIVKQVPFLTGDPAEGGVHSEEFCVYLRWGYILDQNWSFSCYNNIGRYLITGTEKDKAAWLTGRPGPIRKKFTLRYLYLHSIYAAHFHTQFNNQDVVIRDMMKQTSLTEADRKDMEAWWENDAVGAATWNIFWWSQFDPGTPFPMILN